jgi:hypothetical protein
MRICLSVRQHLAKGDASDGKHERDFDIQANQDQKRRVAGRTPDRRYAGGLKHQRVPNLVEPVHAPEGQPGKDQVPVSSFYLMSIHVDHQGEDRNHVPLELAAIPQDAERS